VLVDDVIALLLPPPFKLIFKPSINGSILGLDLFLPEFNEVNLRCREAYFISEAFSFYVVDEGIDVAGRRR